MFVNTLESLLHPRMLTIMTIDEHGFASYLHHSNRCTTSLSLGLGQSLLIEISPLLSISQLSMSIAELGKVEGSNLLSLLNLLLVRLDLGLQLVNESLHALMILPVFIRCISHLLDASLRLAKVLLAISHPAGLSINFRFKLTDPGLHLVHGLLSSLKSIGLSIIQSGLHVLDLALKQLTIPLKALSQLLLIPKLISQTGSINHGFLGFLLRETSLRNHLIQITMKSLHLRLQLPLGSSNGLVLASLVRQLLIGVRELLFSDAASSVRLLKKGPSLLQSILSRVSPALIGKQLITDNFFGPLLILKLSLGLPDLLVVLLNGLLGVLVSSIGMFQSSVKFNHIRFQLLLHPKSFSFALGLLFKSLLHGINSLLEVLTCAIEFIFLLSNAPLNLLPNLGELKLSTQYLILLLLKSTFSIL